MAITGDQILSEAQKFLGVPYVFGGDTPSGFDCSGLVYYVMHQLGDGSFPRTADAQGSLTVVDSVSPQQMQPGDLIFSYWAADGSDYGVEQGAKIGHVGIYAGGGKVLEASFTGTPVRYVPYDAAYQAATTRIGAIKGVSYNGVPAPGGSSGGGSNGGGATLAGLFSLPDAIIQFFKDADSFLKLVGEFFQPSTLIRIGAGGAGIVLLIFGIIFLGKAAMQHD